ncbi:MAG: hypothetical protein OEN56_09065 [Gemmatimonadota bacterium]|nr:hypothetical protein [Gemmatimonadota bacterium]
MKRWVALGALSLLVVLPRAASAQDTEWNRYTLEDLGGVFVRMDVAEECQPAGVSAADFEADVSLALIESAVGVLTMEEMLAHPAHPELRVTIDCAAGGNANGAAIAYSVELRVQQAAQMLRDTQITLPEAVTWFTSNVGVTSGGAASDAVGSTLMEQVEAFSTAWSEINRDAGGI